MIRPVLLFFGLFTFSVSVQNFVFVSPSPFSLKQLQKKRKTATARPMGDSSLSHRTPVHKALGGGRVADVLLWRKWCGGAVMLVSATTMWYLFEIAGYNFLTFVANVLLILAVILFFWAKSASLLNRPLPPIPNMEISERTVVMISDELHVWINCVLAIAHGITIGRNLKLFIKVAVGLWFLSFIGSIFNFLTLVYIGKEDAVASTNYTQNCHYIKPVGREASRCTITESCERK
ncbi:hypothetical protein V6N13_130777 [Hibiscus sabdariffa]